MQPQAKAWSSSITRTTLAATHKGRLIVMVLVLATTQQHTKKTSNQHTNVLEGLAEELEALQ